MTRLPAIACLVIAFAGAAAAQDDSAYVPLPALPLGDSLINMPTTTVLAPRVWEVRFTHRFSEPINKGDEHSLWGLDSSADIGLGLAWAPARDLQLSLFRTDVLDDYELAAKYVVLRQARAVPLSVSVRAGLDWRTAEGLSDRVSWFAQALLSRRLGDRTEVFIAPTVVTDAGPFETGFNIPIGIAWMLRPNLSVVAEVIPENTDLPHGSESDIGWSIGLKRAIGGHFFEILLTDTRGTHVDQYTSSSLFPGGGTEFGGIDSGDVHLGFNIERRFGGRK